MTTSFSYKVDHVTFNFGNKAFRYQVEPQDDELLSSWLVRTAYEHLTDPATFVNLYLPEYRNNFWNRDIDVMADDEMLIALSRKSRIDRDRLYQMTLRSYEGFLAEKILTNTRNLFIQPLVSRGRVKKKAGLRYCPLCLKGDKAPFFRKKWRLSFSTACIRHECFLLDRCPQCGTPLSIYRRHEDFAMPNCYRCGFRFREAKVETIDKESYGLSAIKCLYEVLDSGIFQIDGDRYTYSFLYFGVLKQFVKITYYWGKRRGFLDHEVMNEQIEYLPGRQKQSLIESIPLKEQYLLFSGIVRLFENYPSQAIAFCRENGLRRSDLIKDIPYLPWFFYEAVVDVFDFEGYRVSLEEVANARDYLIKRDGTTCRQSVARFMGRSLDPRKIKGIRGMFLNNGKSRKGK